MGNGCNDPYRTWCYDANATISPRILHIFFYYNTCWHGDVYHRKPFPGVIHGTDKNRKCV